MITRKQEKKAILAQHARDEQGQALVEYALILFLVALVCVGSLSAIGVSVSAAINAMAAGL
jgi:Flp pilus assembly pilin Flp